MNKPLQFACYLLLVVSLSVTTTGCATSCNSWSPKNWFANRPRPLQNLFRGASCSTCNPPMGKLQMFGANSVKGCQDGSCGGNGFSGEEPVYQGEFDGAVPYYPSDMQAPMGQPMLSAPGPDMSSAPIRTNYPSSAGYDSGSQIGSGLKSFNSDFETNAEAITPPMYGSRNDFN